MGGKYNRASQT